MSQTLLQICQRALRERAQFSVPASIVNNGNPTAIRLLVSADRTGRALAKLAGWEVKQLTHTFSTVAGVDSYDLPDGFQRFSNLTAWDRTAMTRLLGPSSSAAWQDRVSGSVSASPLDTFFRITGDRFRLWPTPTAASAMAYEYFSKMWVCDTGNPIPSKEYFAADSDTCVFDDDLMVIGTRERYQSIILGIDFMPSAEYSAMIGGVVAADGGKPAINFGGSSPRLSDGTIPANIPIS